MNNIQEELNYYITDDEEIIDSYTGEVISLDKIKQAKLEKAMDNLNKYNSDFNEDYILFKYKGETYNCIRVKENYHFNKMYRTALRTVMGDKNLKINSRALLMTMIPYLSFPLNKIVIPGCNKLEDIGKIIGLQKTATYEALKNLEKLDIIKREKVGGQTIVYINPFLFASGGIIERSTLEKFKDSFYNPNNKKL
jgi:hypothetical protein